MEEYLPLLKKIAIPLGLVLGFMLRGTKFDPSKIVLFGRKNKNEQEKSKSEK